MPSWLLRVVRWVTSMKKGQPQHLKSVILTNSMASWNKSSSTRNLSTTSRSKNYLLRIFRGPTTPQITKSTTQGQLSQHLDTRLQEQPTLRRICLCTTTQCKSSWRKPQGVTLTSTKTRCVNQGSSLTARWLTTSWLSRNTITQQTRKSKSLEDKVISVWYRTKQETSQTGIHSSKSQWWLSHQSTKTQDYTIRISSIVKICRNNLLLVLMRSKLLTSSMETVLNLHLLSKYLIKIVAICSLTITLSPSTMGLTLTLWARSPDHTLVHQWRKWSFSICRPRAQSQKPNRNHP